MKNVVISFPDGSEDEFDKGITGYDLAKRIFEIKLSVPVILCTGYSETVSPEKAVAAGIKKLIYKPLSRNELAKIIRELLDKKK